MAIRGALQHLDCIIYYRYLLTFHQQIKKVKKKTITVNSINSWYWYLLLKNVLHGKKIKKI